MMDGEPVASVLAGRFYMMVQPPPGEPEGEYDVSICFLTFK